MHCAAPLKAHPNAVAWVWLCVFGLAYVHGAGRNPSHFESGFFARSLLDHGTYAWGAAAPWSMGHGTLTAHKGPLISWILLPVYSLFPATWQLDVIALINATSEALALVAITRLVGSQLARWVRPIFCASPFILMNIPVVADMAVSHALLAWAAFWLVKADLSERLPVWRNALAGVMLALAALSLPASLALLPVACAWVVQRDGRRAWRSVVMLVSVYTLLVGSWTLRNYHVFDRLIVVASNLPAEIYYGNNPRATGGMYNAQCMYVTQLDDAEKARLAGLDEPTGYNVLGDMARQWIVSHPVEALVLRARAFVFFWHPQAFWLAQCEHYAGVKWRAMAWLNGVLLLSALVGLGLLARRRAAAFWPVVVCIGLFCGIYTLTHADIGWRYRAPVEPILCVLTALAWRTVTMSCAKNPSTGSG